MTNTACRYFNGIAADFRGEPMCAKGHDVRSLAGTEPGMAWRLPCAKTARDGAAFECADLDRFTEQEAAEREDRMREALEKVAKALPFIMGLKAEMIAAGEGFREVNCPWCSAETVLSVSVALGYNDHVAAFCKKCSKGFRE